jgi:hypothetical protein
MIHYTVDGVFFAYLRAGRHHFMIRCYGISLAHRSWKVLLIFYTDWHLASRDPDWDVSMDSTISLATADQLGSFTSFKRVRGRISSNGSLLTATITLGTENENQTWSVT